jgi:hypothetical protein
LEPSANASTTIDINLLYYPQPPFGFLLRSAGNPSVAAMAYRMP